MLDVHAFKPLRVLSALAALAPLVALAALAACAPAAGGTRTLEGPADGGPAAPLATDAVPATARDGGCDACFAQDAAAVPSASDAAPTSDAGLALPAPPAGATEYAPYVYTWGFGNPAYAFSSLLDLRRQSGLGAATLAFVIAAGGACALSNDGTTNLIETTLAADIAAFRADGGRLKVSFGGADGTYLENACTSADALESLIEGFVARTGLSDLDFDVEQWEAMTPAVNALRAEAFAGLTRRRPEVRLSFTLPVLPTGLVDVGANDALGLLRRTVAAGVPIAHVNLMTMDYGNVPGSMGDLAIQALQSTLSQLRGIYPSASDAALYELLGATPMIGQNDSAGETFTLDDAATLTRFAQRNALGLVSFWAIDRDQPCQGGLDRCSLAETQPYAFHNVFRVLSR
jgi:chitinase